MQILRRGQFEYKFDLTSGGGKTLLGQGGYAHVYKGKLIYTPANNPAESLEVPVAIKDIDEVTRQERYEKAEIECENLVFFNNLETKQGDDFYPNTTCHPNIVKIFACLLGPGPPPYYAVLELMDTNMHAYISRIGIDRTGWGAFNHVKPELMLDNVKAIMKGMLGGLAFLHANGYIHSDIKMGNILIKTHKTGDKINQVSEVRIADFDSAYNFVLYDRNSGNTTTICNRPPEAFLKYMCLDLDEDNPIQLGFQLQYNDKMDIYSCGVCLFQMLYTVGRATTTFPMDWQETLPISLNQDMPNLWLYQLSRRYGNPALDDSNVMWPLGRQVALAIKARFPQQSYFAVTTYNPTDAQQFEIIKILSFQNRVPDQWCQVVIEMMRYNPDRRPSAAKLLSMPLLDGTGQVVNVPRKFTPRRTRDPFFVSPTPSQNQTLTFAGPPTLQRQTNPNF